MHEPEVMKNGVIEAGASNSSRLANFDFLSSEALDKAKRDAEALDFARDPNALYQTCLEILRQADLEAEIPRLVVFGQQSMGKTTLLDMIMGGPIGYSSTTTGTKCPVVIYLKPSVKSKSSGNSISSQKMYSTNVDEVQCKLNGKPLPISELPKAMKKLMTSTKTISFNQIKLEMAVPNGVHAVFVDLPGIKIDSKDESDLTRDVVKEYVRNNPNDLYILVKKASDDPANWSYDLKEFILGDRDEGGLGLTRRQTMVVGTRSVEFLKGEMNDIRTYRELRERVNQRTIKDSANQALPLYLLELFSLSFEEKERMTFDQQKQSMQNQIMKGRNECYELLRTKFIHDDAIEVVNTSGTTFANRLDLARTFDFKVFRDDLNDNFQGLLKEQLKKLMKDIDYHLNLLREKVATLEQEKSQQDSLNVCHIMEKFIGNLVDNTKFMMEGTFSVHLCSRGGKNFLEDHGGNLEDNLRQGDAIAKGRFPKDEYKEDYFDKLLVDGELALRKMRARELSDKQYIKEKENQKAAAAIRRAGNTLYSSAGADAVTDTASTVATRPYPGRVGIKRAGQIVRTGDSGLYGFIKEENVNPDNIATQSQTSPAPDRKPFAQYVTPVQQRPLPGSTGYSNGSPRNTPAGDGRRARIGYSYFFPNTNKELIEDKVVLESLFKITVPLVYHWTPKTPLPCGRPLLAWRVIRRADGWRGFEPVLIKHIEKFKTEPNPWTVIEPTPLSSGEFPSVDVDGIPKKISNGIATVLRVIIEDNKALLTLRKRTMTIDSENETFDTSGLATTTSETESTYYEPLKYRLLGKEELYVPLTELFVDSSPDLQFDERDDENDSNLSMWQQIGGMYADERLVHQMTIASVIKWFKFHLSNLEPTERFSQSEMLQLLRTVQNVVDKSDTTPLIADLLRENIHHCVMPLVRLTICAAQAAYERILKASLMERKMTILNAARAGPSSAMGFLVQNDDFMSEVEKCIEQYSRAKGIKCIAEIEALTHMQTQVIQFDQLLQVFEGCRQFEADFLRTQHLCGIVTAVREGLAARKQALSHNDVFAQCLAESEDDSKTQPADGEESPFLKLVFDELRIHFWVAKMLLMSSLSSKIFIDFTSGLRDVFGRNHREKVQFSVSPGNIDMSTKNYDTVLRERLMHQMTSSEPLSEDELVAKFRFNIDKSTIPKKLCGASRALEFLVICKRAVDMLYKVIESGHSVDFLRRLEFDSPTEPPWTMPSVPGMHSRETDVVDSHF